MRTHLRRVIGAAAVAGAVAVGIALVPERGTPPPSPTPYPPEYQGRGWVPVRVDEPIRRFFGNVHLTDEESAALVETGRRVKEAPETVRSLPDSVRAGLRSVQEKIAGVDCTAGGEECRRYQIDVTRCLEDAADIIARRRRERGAVPYELSEAAFGAAVVAKEGPMQSLSTVLHFCRLLTVAQAKYSAGRP